MRTPLYRGGSGAGEGEGDGNMSLASDFVSGPEDMKTTPGKMNSSRLRKSQNPNSIYVPPALRKRRSEPSHKVGSDVASSAPRPPRREAPVNKKCENSYLLFGLEDKSNRPLPASAETLVKHLKENVSKPKHAAPAVKKCDNSYLLFSSTGGDASDPAESSAAVKKPPVRGSDETPRPRTRATVPEPQLRIKSWETTEPPDDLSCGVGSLSVHNKPFRSPSSLEKDPKDYRSPRTSSQKKCDNSYFLFDGDSIDDSKYNAAPYRDKTHSQSPSSCTGTFNASNSVSVNSDKSVKLTDERRSNQDNQCSVGEDMVVDSKAGDFEPSDNIEDYVVEIYDFPKTLRTQDMMTIFSCYVQEGFFVKWVDETHALGVFPTPFCVADVLKKKFDMVSVRGLSEACPASIEAASALPVPSASRPRTCPSSARRLIGGALGLRILVSDEIKQAEKKMLQDAKEERRLAARQREEAWEGTIKSTLPPS